MTTTGAATPVSPRWSLRSSTRPGRRTSPPESSVSAVYPTGRSRPTSNTVASCPHPAGRVAPGGRRGVDRAPDGDWLVVVTDRDDDDLGAGVLAHFVWQRLRSPTPGRPSATGSPPPGIDPSPTQVRESRDLASACSPRAARWLARGAGRDPDPSRCADIRRRRSSRLERDAVDALGVLRWTMRPGSVTAVATFRAESGDRLCDETLDWLAERAGRAWSGSVRSSAKARSATWCLWAWCRSCERRRTSGLRPRACRTARARSVRVSLGRRRAGGTTHAGARRRHGSAGRPHPRPAEGQTASIEP